MPGGVRGATSVNTMPLSLAVKFAESHLAQVLCNEYHDGASQRFALVTGGRRSWKLSRRLTPAQIQLLRSFAESLQGEAFYFYNPVETIPPFSSNPIGESGRYLVRFNSDWSQIDTIGRSDCELELIEVTGAPADAAPPPLPPIHPTGGPGDDGGGTTTPPAGEYLLYVSDNVAPVMVGATGPFTFTNDPPPGGSYIATVAISIRYNHTGSTGQHARLTGTLSSNLTPSPFGSFFGATENGPTVVGPNTIYSFDPPSNTLYPPLHTPTPAFTYSVDNIDVNEATIRDFELSVVEVPTATPVRVGWALWHPSQGFIYSLYDDLAACGGALQAGLSPEAAAFNLPVYNVVATQALSFSVITLRLIAMDSYYPTPDIPVPAEMDLGGRTGTFKVTVGGGGGVHTITLGTAPATITLGSAVSVAVGEAAISLVVTSASTNWIDADYETAPFPLVSVDLT